MTLKDILECSLPDGPGYEAPRAPRPLDVDTLVYADAASAVPAVTHDAPPFRTLVYDAVKSIPNATVERIVADIQALPVAVLLGTVDTRRVLLALRNMQRKGRVRWLPHAQAWVITKASDR